MDVNEAIAEFQELLKRIKPENTESFLKWIKDSIRGSLPCHLCINLSFLVIKNRFVIGFRDMIDKAPTLFRHKGNV